MSLPRKVHTRKELLSLAKDILQAAGDEFFETDAEILLCYVLDTDRIRLFLDQLEAVSEEDCLCILDLAGRVATGEPVQYVTGEAYFMGYRFAVNPTVLIPRPETEVLCEIAIDLLTSHGGASRVLDLCTGSGVLAVSIARAVPNARLTASDISADALAVARANALTLGVSDRITFVCGDLFSAIDVNFDLIVTNPPYIRTGDLPGLPPHVRCHEPGQALDGGVDGLDFYRRIATEAGVFLTNGGTLLAEIGCEQGADVKAALKAAGFFEVSVFKDLTGRDRIVRAVKR
ncbi:release factor glutamine methyltransferase [Clostridia bacterium]|nr:release factor glutamine methyltransferase [Clostridia bacterium]